MNGWKALGFETYYEYIQSTIWNEKREAMIKKMNGRCELCKTEKTLQVHHLHYDSVGCEKTRDLVVLCSKCHKQAHLTNNESIKEVIERRI